jgi:hypothetical protein
MTPSSSNTKSPRGRGSASFERDAEQPLRGVFVHRRGEDTADEKMLANFWQARGLEVDALENPADRYSRLPDLRLSRDSAPWAYCEVKTVLRHSWTVRILHDDRPIEERREVTSQTVNERVKMDLIMAARQLNAGNPGHALLNFVVLINRDPDASPAVLARVFATQSTGHGRGLAARRAARLAQEVQSFRRNVDLCLWAKPESNGKLVMESCLLFNPALRSFAEEVTGLRGKKLVSLEPAA